MKKELLSPAGSFETLKQAIHNGCDAVYLGGKKFGARKFASNFDEEEMKEAIKYCHLYGVKIYVTVNTLQYNNEIMECLDYVKFLHESGVDAVIMQDLGLITLTRKVLPNLDIHVSTQAHTHNIEQIKLFESLGVKRIVIARETPIDVINKLDTNLEIEAFIHGALCICYSGQCLFSSMLLNRSGNRGECAGICRLPFKLLEDDKEIKTNGSYLLSPRELNTTNHVKELLESNITSFKIEGRMKAPTTIGYITRLYRYLIDHYEKGEEIKLTDDETKKLMVLFNREYTDGYLFNSTSKELMNIKSPNHVGIKIGDVLEVSDKKIKIKLADELNQEDGIRFSDSNLGMVANFIYDKKDNLISGAKENDIVYLDNKIGLNKLDSVYKTVDNKLLKELENYDEKKISIDISAIIVGDTITLTLNDGVNVVSNSANIVEVALNGGTTKERIIEQLTKLGNSPFTANKVEVELDSDIFIPISKLNELRRNLIDELIRVRENSKKEVIINDIPTYDKETSSSDISINVLVRTEEQLKACLEENINNIYVTNYELYEKYKNNSNIYLRLSRVLNEYKDYSNERLLVGEIGSINKYISNNKVIGDYFLNVTNGYTVEFLRKLGLYRITLSTESSIDAIESIIEKSGNKDIEVIIYGRLEAMIMKYNIIDLLGNDKNKKYSLKDRNGAKYPLVLDDNLTHIFYYKNHDISDDFNKLVEIGVNNFRLELFDETYDEVVNLIKKYKSII